MSKEGDEILAWGAQHGIGANDKTGDEILAWGAQHGVEMPPPAPTGLTIAPDQGQVPPVLAGLQPEGRLGQIPLQTPRQLSEAMGTPPGMEGIPASAPPTSAGVPPLETTPPLGTQREWVTKAIGGESPFKTYDAKTADSILRMTPQFRETMKGYDFAREVLANWGLPNLLPPSEEFSQAIVNGNASAWNFIPMMGGMAARAVEATGPTGTPEQRDAFVEEAKAFGKAAITLPLAAAEPALTGRVWVPGSVPGQGFPGARQGYAALEKFLGEPIDLESWVAQFKQDPVGTAAMTFGPAAHLATKGAGMIEPPGGAPPPPRAGIVPSSARRPLSRIAQVERETRGLPAVDEMAAPEAPPQGPKTTESLQSYLDRIEKNRRLEQGHEKLTQEIGPDFAEAALPGRGKPETMVPEQPSAGPEAAPQGRTGPEVSTVLTAEDLHKIRKIRDEFGDNFARAVEDDLVRQRLTAQFGPEFADSVLRVRRGEPRVEPGTESPRPVEPPRAETPQEGAPPTPETPPPASLPPPAGESAPPVEPVKVSERAPEPTSSSPPPTAEAPAPTVPAAAINAIEAELAQKHGTDALLEQRKARGTVPDEQYVAGLRDYMEKNKGKEKPQETAPTETGPAPRNYMKGEQVQWGKKRRYIQAVEERNGEQWLKLPTKSQNRYTTKNSPTQWVRASEVSDINVTEPVKPRSAPKVPPPEYPMADMDKLTDWIIAQGGLSKKETAVDPGKVAENWGRTKRENKRMRLVREDMNDGGTGRTLETLADDLHQEWPHIWKTQDAAYEWLRDVWAEGMAGEKGTNQRATGAALRRINEIKAAIKDKFGEQFVKDIEDSIKGELDFVGALDVPEESIWKKSYDGMMADAKLERRAQKRAENKAKGIKRKRAAKRRAEAEAKVDAEESPPTAEEKVRAERGAKQATAKRKRKVPLFADQEPAVTPEQQLAKSRAARREGRIRETEWATETERQENILRDAEPDVAKEVDARINKGAIYGEKLAENPDLRVGFHLSKYPVEIRSKVYDALRESETVKEFLEEVEQIRKDQAEAKRPTMEEAAAAVEEARAAREAREKAEAKAEKKRQADAEKKQGSLTDEETNRRIAEEEETAKKKAEFEAKQTTIETSKKPPKKKGTYGSVWWEARIRQPDGTVKTHELRSREKPDPSWFPNKEVLGIRRKPKKKPGGGGGSLPRLEVSPARQALRRKLFALHSGLDPTIVADLLKIGVEEARRLAKKAGDKTARYPEWETAARQRAQRILAQARAAGIKAPQNLSPQQMKRLWQQQEVQLASVVRSGAVPKDVPAPRPTAELRTFIKEMGGDKGEKAFTLNRLKDIRINIGNADIYRDVKKQLKKVSREGKFALWWAWKGIRRGADGKIEYGALERAGAERPPKSKVGGAMAPSPGTMMPDGRVAGPILADGRQQFYRVIFEDEAKARHDYLKKEYPEAAKVLDQLTASQEDPMFTRMGDRLPSRSQTLLKEREGIEGLTKEEGIAAAAMVKEAYGPKAEGKVIPMEFSLVPESGLQSTTGLRRFRNALRKFQASSRYYKAGAVSEALRKAYAKGEVPDISLEHALAKQRSEFLAEEIHNQVAASLLHLVAEPIKDLADWKGMPKAGYVEFSRAGMYGNSVKFRNFLQRHRQFFEDAGIEVPDAIDATYIAGGKGYKIPKAIAEKLGVFFEDKTSWTTDPKTRALHESWAKMFDEAVSFINVSRLTRPASAMRNLLSNHAAVTAKIFRDFYRGMLDVITPPGADGKAFEMPMAAFVGDIQALIETPLGRYDPRAWGGKGKEILNRIPPEMLGETFIDVLETGSPGKIRNVPGYLLKHVTGFQAMDIYTKRLIREATLNATSLEAWKVAERTGTTGGLSKAKFIEKFKSGVPPEVEALIYRESDMWGGYMYGNIPRALAKAKKSPWFRATVPYPTYYYKLLQTYRELYGVHNFKAMFDPQTPRSVRLNAIANVMAGATMAAIAWKVVDAMTDWDLPEGQDIKDVPYDVQTYGRLRIPWAGDDDGSFWVRLSDVPWFGEVMSARAIWGKNLGFQDYLNERISLGPLFNIGMAWVGAYTRYNQNMTPESRFGKEVFSWLPFTNEMQSLRRLVDPAKREVSRKSNSKFFNFIAPGIDNYPWLSSLLPERTDVYRRGRPRYNFMESLLSWGFLNIHRVDKAGRQNALKLAELMHEEELGKEWKRDYLGRQIDAAGLDPQGRTEAGQLRSRLKAGIQADVRLEFLRREKDVTLALEEGGPAAAFRKMRETTKDIESPMVRYQVTKRLYNMIKMLAKQKAMGLTRMELERTPKYARPEAYRYLQEIRSEEEEDEE